MGRYYDAVGQADLGYGVDATFFEGSATSVDVQVCFVAGTPILLADGNAKPIEQIQPGDIVYARPHDNPTGDLLKCKVVRTFTNRKDTWSLTAQNASTHEQITVRGTAEHPFYVQDKGWALLGELVVGDKLVSASGETLTVVAKEHHSETVEVYNFEVEQAHTYFVGESEGQSLLVHNDCPYCGRGFVTHVVLGCEATPIMAWEAIKTVPSSVWGIGEGIWGTGKEACFYVADIAMVGTEAGQTFSGAIGQRCEYIFTGRMTFEPIIFDYHEMSSIGKSNQPSDPDFWYNSVWNAGRAGLGGGTLGASEITIGVYNFSQDGDAHALTNHMGGVVFGNAASAVGAKATGGNPSFVWKPTPGSGLNPILIRPRAPIEPFPLNPRGATMLENDPYYGQLIRAAREKPVAGKPGHEVPRTYEMILDQNGIQYIEKSGHIPGKMEAPVSVTFELLEPTCGLPKAIAAMESQGGQLGTVVKGGIAMKGNEIWFYPPCANNCTHVFSTPMGQPRGFPMGTSIYTAPNSALYGYPSFRPIYYPHFPVQGND